MNKAELANIRSRLSGNSIIAKRQLMEYLNTHTKLCIEAKVKIINKVIR